MPFKFLALALWLGALNLLVTPLAQAGSDTVGASKTAPDDSLANALAAEMALLDEDFKQAANLYAKAARSVTRADFAERAAQVALHAGRHALAAEMASLWRERDPSAVGAQQLQSAAYLNAGRTQKALASLRGLMVDEAGVRLALEVLQPAKPATGLKLLRALQEKPGWQDFAPQSQSPVALALRWKDIALAKELADRSAQKHPKEARAMLWRAAVALAEKLPDRAADDYRAALALDPANVELRISYVQLLAQLKRLDEVKRVLRDAPETDVRLYRVALSLAVSEKSKRQYNELARQVRRDRTLAESERAFLLAQLAELQEQPKQALEHYRSVSHEPEVHDAALRIAVLSFGQEPQAARMVLRAVQQSGAQQAHAAFLLEAELDQQAKDLDRALNTLTRGLETFPDDIELLYARALVGVGLRQIDRTEADLRRILRLSPRHVAAMNALGYTLLTETDRLPEAGAMIEAAAALDPKDPAILDSLGWLHFRRGDPKKALEPLRAAFALSPDSEIAAHLGEVLWTLGKFDEAREIWRGALEKEPEHSALVETVRRLDPGMLEPRARP